MSASENPIPNVTKHSSSTTLKLFGFPITPASNKRFKCNFCSREFANHQALGGHQNAHKRERQKAKLAQFRDLIPHHQRFTVPSPIHHPIMVAAHGTPGSSSPFVHDHPGGSPAAWDPQPLLSMIPDEEELDQLHILTPSGAAAGTAKPEGPFIEVHNYVDGDVDLNLNPAVIPSNSKDKDSDRRS